MVKYNIISTGSDGNATILEDFVLIDCGVPYRKNSEGKWILQRTANRG